MIFLLRFKTNFSPRLALYMFLVQFSSLPKTAFSPFASQLNSFFVIHVLCMFVLSVSYIGSNQFYGLSHFKIFLKRHILGQLYFLYFSSFNPHTNLLCNVLFKKNVPNSHVEERCLSQIKELETDTLFSCLAL